MPTEITTVIGDFNHNTFTHRSEEMYAVIRVFLPALSFDKEPLSLRVLINDDNCRRGWIVCFLPVRNRLGFLIKVFVVGGPENWLREFRSDGDRLCGGGVFFSSVSWLRFDESFPVCVFFFFFL